MADIDLERRRRSRWPWVIAALVAILAVWGIAEVLDRDGPMAGDTDFTDPAAVQPVPAAEMPGGDAAPAIADFRESCVDAPANDGDMGRQHQFTISCIESMAAALDAAVRADTIGDLALDERLNTLRERAAEVRESDPAATTHAGTVARAFEAGAEVVEAYQEQRATGAADYAASVRDATDAIDPDQPLLQQDDAVRSYFQEIGDALQSMTT